jgi:uncharacterized protein (DUF58 family)
MLRNKAAYLLFLIGIGVYAVLYNRFFMGVIFIVALFFPIVLFIILFISSFFIRTEFDTSRVTAQKGESLNLTINLTNKSIFPISQMKIKLLYFNEYTDERKKSYIQVALDGKSKQKVSCQISSKYCGNLKFKLMSIKIYDYFRLWSISKRLNETLNIMVSPEVYDFPCDIIYPNNQLIAETDKFSEFKPGDDPSELFGIREYREGDKLNRIHRKLSYKQEQLIMKEFSDPINESILVLFDWFCGFKGEKRLEYVDNYLGFILSLSHHLLVDGHVHQLGWLDQEDYRNLSIQNNEDAYLALETLLASKLPSGYHSVIEENYMCNKQKNFTHLLYITSELKEDEIINLANSYKGTLLYVIFINELQKEPVSAEFRQFMQELKIVLFELDIKNIKENLKSIVL